MSDLKACFEKVGFTNVVTFIQSGNVIFESNENNTLKLRSKIEKTLSKNFSYTSVIVLFSQTQYERILKNVPSDWKKRNDIRCYIAFVREPVRVTQVMKAISLKHGIDFISPGPQAIYMTTLMSGLTKSGFTKFIGTKVYKEVTMRNYRSSQKILALVKGL
jgi:uncharacterized protein (DUF1697 family)